MLGLGDAWAAVDVDIGELDQAFGEGCVILLTLGNWDIDTAVLGIWLPCRAVGSVGLDAGMEPLLSNVVKGLVLGSILCRFTRASTTSLKVPGACLGGGGGGGAALTALKIDAACICDQAQFIVHVFLVFVQ